jgi:hypothetical protein
VFTAVIQPPLVLFATVPAAYFLFHGAKIGGVKDILINCGYPLIERFPLMFFTALTVLALGLVRWFVLPKFQRPVDDPAAAEDGEAASSARRSRRPTTADEAEDAAAGGLVAMLSAKLTKLTAARAPRSSRVATRRAAGAAEAAPPRRSPGTGRAPRPRPAADTQIIDQPVRRPQRGTRPRPAADEPHGLVEPGEPRRTARQPRRTAPPPSDRRGADRREQGDAYGPQRTGRSDQRRADQRRADQRRSDALPRRQHRADDPYEPGDRFDPRPARPAPRGSSPGGARGMGPNGRGASTNGARDAGGDREGSGTRHPVSRVRYRGSDDAEPRPEPRPDRRPRQPRNREADSWEYDV